MDLPNRMIERLIAYRRLLARLRGEGRDRIYSHELAAIEGLTPAQVRRDIMTIGYAGSPAKGYEISGLLGKLVELLEPAGREGMALVGVGHVGKALLAYFTGRNTQLGIAAAFDIDPERAGRVVLGCRCHHVADLERIVQEAGITVGIIAVPGPAAQEVADRLVRAGIRGLVNFAPVRLRTPAHVYVENVDLTVALEKVAYFARSASPNKETLA
jgi:redox-sensing transcriptional repressor